MKPKNNISELEMNYENFKKILNDYNLDLPYTLVLLANYIFDLYPELYKRDILYKDIDVNSLKLPENYSELQDIYAFQQQSYVFTTLNAAHDLLLVAEDLRNKGLKVE